MNNFNNFGLPVNNNPFINPQNGVGGGNTGYFAPTKPMDYDGYFGSQTKKPSFWDQTKMFFSQYGTKIFGWGVTIFGGLGAFALGKKFIDLDVPYGKNAQKPSDDASLMAKAKYHLCTFLSDTVGVMKPYEAQVEEVAEEPAPAPAAPAPAAPAPGAPAPGAPAPAAPASVSAVPAQELVPVSAPAPASALATPAASVVPTNIELVTIDKQTFNFKLTCAFEEMLEDNDDIKLSTFLNKNQECVNTILQNFKENEDDTISLTNKKEKKGLYIRHRDDNTYILTIINNKQKKQFELKKDDNNTFSLILCNNEYSDYDTDPSEIEDDGLPAELPAPTPASEPVPPTPAAPAAEEVEVDNDLPAETVGVGGKREVEVPPAPAYKSAAGFFENAKYLKIGFWQSYKFSTMLKDSSGKKLSAFLNYNYADVQTILGYLASQNPIELSRADNKKLIFEQDTDNTYTITIKQGEDDEKIYKLILNTDSKKIKLKSADEAAAEEEVEKKEEEDSENEDLSAKPAAGGERKVEAAAEAAAAASAPAEEEPAAAPTELPTPAPEPTPAESVVNTAVEQKLNNLTNITTKGTTISNLLGNLLSQDEFNKLNPGKQNEYFKILSNISDKASDKVKAICKASIIVLKNIQNITKEDIDQVDENKLSLLKNERTYKKSNIEETYNNYIDKLQEIVDSGANDEIKNTAKIHLIIAKDEITDEELNDVKNIDITKLNLFLKTKIEYVDKLNKIVEANTEKNKNVAKAAAEVKAKVLNSVTVTSFRKSGLFTQHFCLSENELSLISPETQKQYVEQLSNIFRASNDKQLKLHVANAKHTALQKIKNCKDIQDFLLTDDEYKILIDKSSYYETLTNLISKNQSNDTVIAAIATAKVNYLTKEKIIPSDKIEALKLSKAEYDALISKDKKDVCNAYTTKLVELYKNKNSSTEKQNKIEEVLDEIGCKRLVMSQSV